MSTRFSWNFYGDFPQKVKSKSFYPAARDGALQSLGAMLNYCNGVQCRHRTIVEYFGQRLDADRVQLTDMYCANPRKEAG